MRTSGPRPGPSSTANIVKTGIGRRGCEMDLVAVAASVALVEAMGDDLRDELRAKLDQERARTRELAGHRRAGPAGAGGSGSDRRCGPGPSAAQARAGRRRRDAAPPE